jgi:hypothetical protein
MDSRPIGPFLIGVGEGENKKRERIYEQQKAWGGFDPFPLSLLPSLLSYHIVRN